MTETENTPKLMVPMKPYYALYQNNATARIFGNDPKRIMYIDSCESCRYKLEGAEDGGKIDRNDETVDWEEEDVWYYCRHPQYEHWPKRIGQLENTKEIPYFCPLISIIKVDDSVVKVVTEEEKPKRERVRKQTPIQSSGQSEMVTTDQSVVTQPQVDQNPQ